MTFVAEGVDPEAVAAVNKNFSALYEWLSSFETAAPPVRPMPRYEEPVKYRLRKREKPKPKVRLRKRQEDTGMVMLKASGVLPGVPPIAY